MSKRNFHGNELHRKITIKYNPTNPDHRKVPKWDPTVSTLSLSSTPKTIITSVRSP